MQMPLSELREIHRFDGAEHARLALAVRASLGPDWATTTATSADSLPLIHLPTQLTFLVIPGGTFEMSLTQADIEELQRHVPWDANGVSAIKHGCADVSPPHPVTVAPFLLAEEIEHAEPASDPATGASGVVSCRGWHRGTRGAHRGRAQAFAWSNARPIV